MYSKPILYGFHCYQKPKHERESCIALPILWLLKPKLKMTVYMSSCFFPAISFIVTPDSYTVKRHLAVTLAPAFAHFDTHVTLTQDSYCGHFWVCFCCRFWGASPVVLRSPRWAEVLYIARGCSTRRACRFKGPFRASSSWHWRRALLPLAISH